MIRWQHPDRPIILASQSPRRKQILTLMGFIFDTAAPESIDEESFIKPDDLDGSLRKLALAKAAAISVQYPEALVLGADTVVVKDTTILGKPSGAENAKAMLSLLSGTTHKVYTSVALTCRSEGFEETGIACTDVTFRDLTNEEIATYLENALEYRDKAGAYGIQGKAMAFIDRIDGCFYNVMGLPVTSTINLFKKYILRKESTDV